MARQTQTSPVNHAQMEALPSIFLSWPAQTDKINSSPDEEEQHFDGGDLPSPHLHPSRMIVTIASIISMDKLGELCTAFWFT